jgi:hypothetical protein
MNKVSRVDIRQWGSLAGLLIVSLSAVDFFGRKFKKPN